MVNKYFRGGSLQDLFLFLYIDIIDYLMIDYIEAKSITIKFIQNYNTWVSKILTTTIEYKFLEEEYWLTYSKNVAFNYKPVDVVINIYSPTGKIWINNIKSTGWLEHIEIVTNNIKEINDEIDDMTAQELLNKIEALQYEMTSLKNNISTIQSTMSIIYNENLNNNLNETYNYEEDYLRFEILEDGEITWHCTSSVISKNIQYNINNTEWKSISSTTIGTPITVKTNDIIYFRGNNICYSDAKITLFSINEYNYFNSTCKFNISGNILSLLSNVFNDINLYEAGTFFGLFSGCTNLINANELSLPTIKLTNYCYTHMFHGCTSLTTAPKLPAMTLAAYCYCGMFSGCSNLTTAPELPADILAFGCYSSMFSYCINLINIPILHAKQLIDSCYQNMFVGCEKINKLICLCENSPKETTNIHIIENQLPGILFKNSMLNEEEFIIENENRIIPITWIIQDYEGDI